MAIFSILYSGFKNTNNIFRSLVGYNLNKNIYEDNKSELNINNWRLLEFFKFISNIFIVKLPIYCPNWMPNIIKVLFFGNNSKLIIDSNESSENNCKVLYINGILSNEKVVLETKNILTRMIKKPINILHNVTDSLLSDLIECLIGKTTQQLTEPSTIALFEISKLLLDPKTSKIIIIAHSQGTIITATLLNNLYKLGLDKKEYLEKLEIYAFANCSSKMKYIIDDLPYMEHFANKEDFVAKLGCNCDKDIKELIDIDGKIFINENGSGHMLNSHYLLNFKNNFPESKFNIYIDD